MMPEDALVTGVALVSVSEMNRFVNPVTNLMRQ